MLACNGLVPQLLWSRRVRRRPALLFPITDAPHRLSTVPGERTLLVDDALATELAPSGRLGGLLSALTGSAPAGSAVRQAVRTG